MKRNFRYFVFFTLIVCANPGAQPSLRSSAAQERSIDPACVSTCILLLQQCFAQGGKNGNEHACLSVYRHCVAQCGKHE